MRRPSFHALVLAMTVWAFLFAALPHSADAQTRPLYKNPSAPIGARVADLLRRMTLEEKVAQMEAIAPGPARGLDSLFSGGDTAQYGARGKRLGFGAITGARQARSDGAAAHASPPTASTSVSSGKPWTPRSRPTSSCSCWARPRA